MSLPHDLSRTAASEFEAALGEALSDAQALPLRRLRGALNIGPQAVVLVDRNGRIVLGNDRAQAMFGYAGEELEGRPIEALMPERLRARHRGLRYKYLAEPAQDSRAMNGGREIVGLRRDGSEFPAEIHLAPLPARYGTLISAWITDLTDTQRALDELRESQAYNRTLIEASIDAVVVIDLLGVVTDVNSRTCALTGHTREQLVGAHAGRFLVDPGELVAGMTRVLSHGDVSDLELALRRADGDSVLVSVNAGTFRDADGRLSGILAIARDITEQKRREDALRLQQLQTRSLLDASSEILLCVDAQLLVIDANARALRAFGRAREDLIGGRFDDWMADPAAAQQLVVAALQGTGSGSATLAVQGASGQRTDWHFSASVLRVPGAAPRVLLTGRVAGAPAAVDGPPATRTLSADAGLLDLLDDAVMQLDAALCITDANAAGARLCQGPRHALLGCPLPSLFADPAAAERALRALAGADDGGEAELVLHLEGAEPRDLTLRVRPAHDGQALRVVLQERRRERALEAALQRQQAQGRELLEAAVDALLVLDTGGRVLEANERVTLLTGVPRRELQGRLFSSLFETPSSAEAALRHALSQERLAGYELRVYGRMGRVVPVSLHATVRREAPDGRSSVLLALRDLSLQKQFEQEMREQHAYMRSLIESNVDALLTMDLLGSITDVNRRMCELTGRSRAELLRTPFMSYFADPGRAEAVLRQVLSADQLRDVELVVRARDGRETVVAFSATTIRSTDGKLRGVLGSARDITGQKQLEEQLRQRNAELTESMDFLRNVLQSATEYAIVALDLKGRILSWNEGARRIYGYAPEEMIGFGNSAWLHTAEDLQGGRVQKLFDQAFGQGKAEAVFERCHKSGGRLTAAVSMSLRRDAEGRPVGYLLISKDITEQRRLEEELRRKNEELAEQYRRAQEANRLKTEFLANMSHELRTPLNAIIGFSELMYDGKVGPLQPDHHEFMGDILNSANHLLKLINEVLDLAKVEAGRMELVPEPVELDKLVGELRSVLSALMASRRIRLTLELDPRLTGIVADAGKLKQVLYNYLSNAFKFSPEGGEVIVRAVPEGDSHYRLEVEDHGVGIREQDQPRLFQEFQQLDAGVQSAYRGTGLGLALTKRLVEAQGGRVGVQSRHGEGSRFYAVLPVQPNCPLPLETDLGTIPVLGVAPDAPAPRVLVVEGDGEQRMWLTSALSGAGYRVDTAVTGAGALALCRKRSYAAIAFNLALPDQSGWELLRRLRLLERHEQTAAVALAPASGQDALALVVDEYLPWPLSPEQLLPALQRCGARRDDAAALAVIEPDPQRAALLRDAVEGLGFQVSLHERLEAVADAAPLQGVLLAGRLLPATSLQRLQALRMAAGRLLVCGAPADVAALPAAGQGPGLLETIEGLLATQGGGRRA